LLQYYSKNAFKHVFEAENKQNLTNMLKWNDYSIHINMLSLLFFLNLISKKTGLGFDKKLGLVSISRLLETDPKNF